MTLAASGDLDPGFGDVGRLVFPDFPGPALSVAAQDNSIILTGGEVVPDFDSTANDIAQGFAVRVSNAGLIDAAFAAPDLGGVMVIDAEVQSDGRIVGIGNRNLGTGIKPVAFRLERDGSLDTGFAQGGVLELAEFTNVRSVAVDPGGTVAIAGTWAPGETPGGDLKILRLLATGEPDDSFGVAGVFTVFGDIEQLPSPTRILSSAGGGYRVAVIDLPARFWTCRVLALTPDGGVNQAFGDEGYAELGDPGKSVRCSSIAELPDGRLMVAGSEDSRPLVVRLLAGGTVDPNFVAEPLADATLNEATDIAVNPNDGSIVVVFDDTGSSGEPGLVVARLQADGTLDEFFGDGGATWVDLPNVDGRTAFAVPGDVTILENSDVLVSGGASAPFVARLVGGDGNESPGVVGVSNRNVETTEGSQGIVTVRRMGGRTGSVNVAYAANATSGGVFHATAGQDFTAVSGTLSWADGDAGEKQLFIPIAPHDGSPEETEEFVVELSDVQGGAGLGTRETTISIASDAPSAGMFSVESTEIHAAEADAFVQVLIYRNYFYEGAVSVTVTMSSGTAMAGDDFEDESETLSWADGEHGVKTVQIFVTDDASDEPQEQFSLQLSDATGGAVVGPRDSATVFIADDDPTPPLPPPPPPPPRSGGGGPVGYPSLLMLWAAFLLRAGRKRLQD